MSAKGAGNSTARRRNELCKRYARSAPEADECVRLSMTYFTSFSLPVFTS